MALQGPPVTVVASGGLPVRNVGGTAVANGAPMTVLASGGTPVTVVSSPAGAPVHLLNADGTDWTP